MADVVDFSGVYRRIDDLAYRLGNQLDAVGASVGVVHRDLGLQGDELRELRKEFDEFVLQAARTANIQQSETRVVALKAEMDRQFGHYAVVRRTSTGILQAFDVGNVSNEAVTQVSEELMIQTPRYWLAPVLVTLAAWSRDNQEMAEKSVREAYSRDPSKTSLFFALVLRRQGRLEASTRWLEHYLTSLDPRALGREFSVVLEAVSYDAFGARGQQIMTDKMLEWTKALNEGTDSFGEQVRSWTGEIGLQRERLKEGEYAALAELSPEWPTIKRLLEQSSALPVTIDKYTEVANYEDVMPASLEDLLDDILDQLVTEYDQEELPLRRDVLYHTSVIEASGDLAEAQKKADQLGVALDNSMNLMAMQTQAATNPSLVGVGRRTQRICVGSCHDAFIAAVGRFCAYYRAQLVDQVPLDFSPTHSKYAEAFKFKGCRIDTSMAEEDGIAVLQETWEETFRKHMESVSFKNSWYKRPVIIAAVVAFVVFLINQVAGLVVALAAAGVVYYMGKQEQDKCQRDIDKAEQAKENAVAVSVQAYRDATAEFVDAMELYRDLDQQESDLLQLINTWPTLDRLQREAV